MTVKPILFKKPLNKTVILFLFFITLFVLAVIFLIPLIFNNDPAFAVCKKAQEKEAEQACGEIIARGEQETAHKRNLAYFYRGAARGRINDLDGALADFNEALHFDPRAVIVYAYRSAVYYEKGNLNRARDDLDALLSVAPATDAAYVNRGKIYYEQGQEEKALADFKEAIRNNPRHPLAYQYIGVLALAHDELQAALENFNMAIKRDPKRAEAYAYRGEVYYRMGDVAHAYDDYQKALLINASDARALKGIQTIERTKAD